MNFRFANTRQTINAFRVVQRPVNQTRLPSRHAQVGRLANGSKLRNSPVLLFVMVVLLPAASFAQTNYLRLKSFGFYESTSAYLSTPLIQASDGRLYGNSRAGGANGNGTVFRIDLSGSNYVLLKSFYKTNGDGFLPDASLIEATDGKLYGNTVRGGASGVGTVFRIDKNGTGYESLYSFSTNSNGGFYPAGGMFEASDGALYGATSGGGLSNVGTIFSINKDGSGFRIVKEFADGGEGKWPNGVQELSDGRLYGTTGYGGTNGYGTVFSVTKAGGDFVSLFSFSGTNGDGPASVAIEGFDGRLYGATYAGGAYNHGAVFSINKDGTGFSLLKSFEGLAATDGAGPSRMRLCQGSDGYLYGATAYGGTDGSGILFRISTNGSSYLKLRIFSVGDTGRPSGLIEATNGFLYGTCLSSSGTIVRIRKDGTSYQKLADLPSSGGDLSLPQCKLCEGSDHRIYGTAYSGGSSNSGGIFRINLDGSGYTILRNLGQSTGDAANPEAGLTEASDGVLYGSTYGGGGSGRGTVFKINKDGSGFSILKAFLASTSTGQYPRGHVLEASDGWLYGVTYAGGTFSVGTVFKLAKNGTGFLTLRNFIGGDSLWNEPRNPIAGLIEATDGLLYGTSQAGGTNGQGTVYCIQKDGGGLRVLHSFGSVPNDGTQPYAGVLEASDGLLYGVTVSGGASGKGALFRLNKDGTGYAKIADYSSPNTTWLANPYGTLVESPDGSLCGTAQLYTGQSTQGGVFKVNKGGTSYVILHAFNRTYLDYGADGQKPFGGLLKGSDGAFYGTTQTGGDLLDLGTVYKLFDPKNLAISVYPGGVGNWRLRLVGVAHRNYGIDTATNLVNWIRLTNIANSTGTVDVDGIIDISQPFRYYRGVLSP